MGDKISFQQALVEAEASLRLAGLPISRRDDDLFAAVIEGKLVGPLRDVVADRIRAELASKREGAKSARSDS